MTRKALGRGLSALLRDSGGQAQGLQPIPLELVDPNPFQPRKSMASDRLEELARSIRSTGIVQPIIVRRSGERFQLIAGERRWRAARLAALESVPAIVRDISDQEALELAITENALREDLSAIEMAEAYHALQERFGYSQEEIASRIGMDRATVANTIRLLKLPEQIKEMIASGQITPGHARALLACQELEYQLRLAKRIVETGLTVRQAERLASAPPNHPQRKESQPQADANTRAAQLQLERALGTRVRIVGDRNRGKIEISYFSADDLNRLFYCMTGIANGRDQKDVS
jgi:ParB family transcriptional regulator, chromosome partitioning protein